MSGTEKREIIEAGKAALGIELGSTRIKGVLIDQKGNVLAVGVHDWENTLENEIWTYSLEDIHSGLRSCYTSLRKAVEETYDCKLKKVAAIGISAMMHGYMALNKDGEQIAPFQTWRNTNTQAAADELTELFDFNIPLRWTIAHLYQRILDGEKHVRDLDYVSTLSGYIHWKLTGEKVIGVGDAAGMFPIDSKTHDYDAQMKEKFEKLVAPYGFDWTFDQVMPKVLVAGQEAGRLTEEGAAFLDESGTLEAGIVLCPPEGDAGTGMTATNSVAPRTGNVSAGTSTFAMIVLEKALSKLHREIDMVTTPTGFPVAMSHANNGTSDLNAWVGIFKEFSKLMGMDVSDGELFQKLYTESLNGDADCGGLLAYGYYSGENITMINEGRLAFLRTADSHFNLANFMRSHLYTSLGAVKIGLDILTEDEKVKVDRVMGHGGFFKTKGVGQRYLAAAFGAPVTVMDTASEGGAWGIALLAAYLAGPAKTMRLEEYLEQEIFCGLSGETIEPKEEEIKGFEVFMDHYKAGLEIEKCAIENMKW
ncbi:MAG: FGGY-family carbohydrate kinase [Lachnospiraceae bacterium]|nr:FGGY-family carbohydrate kinase [Lachnospiraceae bacterium]